MAQVPIKLYDQRTTPHGADLPTAPRIDVSSGMEGTANALGNLAQTAERANALIAARQEDDAKVYASKALADYGAFAAQTKDDVFQTAQDGWRNATTDMETKLTGWKTEALKNAPSPLAAKYLQQHFDVATPSMIAETYGQELTAHRAWRVDTVKDSIGTASNMLTANPAMYGQTKAGQMTLIDSLSDITDPERAALKDLASDSFATSSIAGQITKNPSQALKDLRDPNAQAGTPVGDLKAGQREKLTREAQSEVDRREAKRKASVTQSVSGEMEAIRLGIPVTNPVSLSTVSAAMGPQMAESLGFFREVGSQTANLATAPLADIVKMANAPDPVATGPADAKGVILFRAKRQAAQQAYQKIVTDPMGEATRTGLAAPVDVMGAFQSGDAGKIGAALQQRIATAQTLSQTHGYPFKAFTADEAAQIGGSIANMDAGHKTQMLGLLAKSLSTQPAQINGAVMAQISGAGTATDGYAGYLMGKKTNLQVGGMTGPQAAALVVKGQSLLDPTDADKKSGVKPVAMPSDSQLQMIWANSVGNAYRFQPTQAAHDYQVFKAAYAGLVANSGKQDGLDNNAAKQAAQIATGGTGSVFGRSTILPWGKTAADVHDSIKLGWPQISKRWGLGSDPGQYDFLPVGHGQYQVMSGNRKVVDPKDGGGVLVVIPQ